jgi:pyruvate kinase
VCVSPVSFQAVVDLVKEYNLLGRGCVALMLDTKGPEVRSGDLAEPIDMKAGKWIRVSAGAYHRVQRCVSFVATAQ